jgi:hypothetical protein
MSISAADRGRFGIAAVEEFHGFEGVRYGDQADLQALAGPWR